MCMTSIGWLVLLPALVLFLPHAALGAAPDDPAPEPAAESPVDGNRLAYLDAPCGPYYPRRRLARLATPQWVGEPGVEAVVVLSIDDLRTDGAARYEAFLRPILDRLKRLDGRAPVSIMTNHVDPADPQVKAWLAEGLSIEAHTQTHPCPLLQGGDLAAAKRSFDECVDLLRKNPGARPVGFRMPCCDSMNSVSPRFFTEIFGKTTPAGNFLEMDSSVFVLFTADDPELPRELVLDPDGRERFRKYIPEDRRLVNFVEDYPYPWVIDRCCWEVPIVMPSDWDAQHLNGKCSPRSVADYKAAIDAVVVKQGIFAICFHPHGWIANDQIVELIDYAAEKHGRKVKFLTFREVYDRLTKNLLGGQPLRAKDGGDNGVRVLDVDNDGFMDVVVGNEEAQQTRRWSPDSHEWQATAFPTRIDPPEESNSYGDLVDHFGVLQENGHASLESFRPQGTYLHHFDGQKWTASKSPGTQTGPSPFMFRAKLRLRDIDGDGVCESILSEGSRSPHTWVAWWHSDAFWLHPPMRDGLLAVSAASMPAGIHLSDARNRDAGLRFVDVDEDGRLDLVFSNHERYGVWLFASTEDGWRCVLSGKRGEKEPEDELPMFVRADGTSNGAWFKDRHLWVQNEETGGKLPHHVDSRSFTWMLRGEPEPPPRSPEASRKAIRVRPGFTVELMAAEPVVMDPIDVAWGPDGTAWVVEMADYPLGMDEAGHVGRPDPIGKPGGRIRTLEDTDGDGRYDRSRVFLEPVAFPSGVMPWRGGVLVTAAPEVFYAEDTDGDGRADLRRTLFTGFREGNQQHRVNHPRWGLDNWVHVANGDSDGRIKSLRTGQVVDISGRDLRLRPDSGRLDPQSGRTQFGRARDDWGNWFGCNNNTPGWHYAVVDHYMRRNPHVAAPPCRVNLSGARDAFPIGRVMTHCYIPQPTPPEGHPGRWTSIGGLEVYRDDLFGPPFAGNLFVSDSVYNVVHRQILSAQGVTFHGERAPDRQRAEFLASADPWFRPTTLRTGPDGALWVVDMCRYVIEHTEWIDDNLEQTLELRRGSDRGRIYRVYPVDRRPRPIPRLDRLDTAGLVAALDTANGWQRDMAQKLLVWRADRAAVEPLEKMALTSRRAVARLHAMCTLDGLGALRPRIVLTALADEHPGVRRHAVRLSEPLLASHQAVGEALLGLVDDPDPQVRLQLAYSLGEWDDPRAARALARLAMRDAGEPYLVAAVMSSAVGHVEAMLAEMPPDPGKDSPQAELLAGLRKLRADVRAHPDAVAAIEAAADQPDRYPSEVLLSRTASEERLAAMEKCRRALDLTGDPERGRQVFVEATCSTCHKLEDIGTEVGPDLRTLVDRSPQNLLLAVVDPNRAVKERYIQFTALTADGLQVSGLPVEETGNSVTLVDVAGKTHVILRRDLEGLVSTGRSHMPEKLEAKLTHQQMVDLFAFIGGAAPPRREFAGNQPRRITSCEKGVFELPASAAEIYGPGIRLEEKYGNLGWWSSSDAYAVWTIEVPAPGSYELWLDWACPHEPGPAGFRVEVSGQTLTGKVPNTGSWDVYRQAKFGELKLDRGTQRLVFRSAGPLPRPLIDLRTLRLVPR